MPIEAAGFGVLFALELGVADPELLVGVRDFETGVGGLSFCVNNSEWKKNASGELLTR